jgi:Nuclease-related domain
MKVMRLRYPGACSACSVRVAAGETAGYDASTRSVTCAVCLARSGAEVDFGQAGDSAHAIYEKKVTRREERVRAAHPRLGNLILKLNGVPASTRAWETGARGERYLARQLDGVDDVVVLHDRRIPGSKANIDHVVVGANGVYVIDAKHYTGLIDVRSTGPFGLGERRLYVGRRNCTSLATKMATQVDAVRTALTTLAEAAAVGVTPVLCFVKGEWPLLFPPDRYGDVLIEGERSVCRLIRTPGPVDASLRELVARHLALRLAPA